MWTSLKEREPALKYCIQYGREYIENLIHGTSLYLFHFFGRNPTILQYFMNIALYSIILEFFYGCSLIGPTMHPSYQSIILKVAMKNATTYSSKPFTPYNAYICCTRRSY
jgi:hypothetical protein